MNYGNYNEPVNECIPCGSAPVEPMTDMLKETSHIATDVLEMTRRITSHLFGIGNPCCEKEAEPKCFRDQLVATRCELIATAEELSKIMSMLGV